MDKVPTQLLALGAGTVSILDERQSNVVGISSVEIKASTEIISKVTKRRKRRCLDVRKTESENNQGVL